MVLLTGVAFWGSSQFTKFSKMRRAEAIVAQIDAARSSYLIDNPARTYADISAASLDSYLPQPCSALLTELSGLDYALSGLSQAKMTLAPRDGQPPVLHPALQ